MVRLLAQAFESLLEVLREHERHGYVIARGSDVECAARDLRAWETDLATRWPRFDPEKLKTLQQGPAEFVPLEEIRHAVRATGQDDSPQRHREHRENTDGNYL